MNEKKGWFFGWPGVIIKYDANLVGVEDDAVIETPTGYYISANYPNPFNPETNINYNLPIYTFVSLKVFDVTGREIKTIVNSYQKPGEHKITFDGSGLPSGVYFYRLVAGGFTKTNKMLLLK